MSDAIQLGHAAQRLLDDDLIQQVFATLKAKYQTEWENATVLEAREVAWHRVQTLKDIQQALRRLRDSGTRAERTTA